MTRRRLVRSSLTLLVTGLCVAYLVWKIDFETTLEVLRDADLGYFAAATAIMLVSTVFLAWRWQQLLAAKDIDEPLGWLTRTYFVSYTAGQVLPTSIGGDAVRVFETARRHSGQTGLITGSVLLDRALGASATLILAAVGFALAVGEYDVGAYLWLEGALILGTVAAAVVIFSRRARRPLSRAAPAARVLAAGAAVAGCVRGHAHLPHPRVAAGRPARVHRGRPGRARAADLAGGEVGRDRPVAAAVLRDGPDPVRRPARAVHASTGWPCARRSSSASWGTSASPPSRPSRPASSSSSSRSCSPSRAR